MTPRLRPLRATGLLLVVGACTMTGPYGSALSYGAESRPTASPTASATTAPASIPLSPLSASSEPSRAGSRAGEGRTRPGRTEASATDQGADEGADEGEDEGTAGLQEEGGDGEASDSPAPVASEPPKEAGLVPPSPPRRPAHRTVTRADQSAEPVLRILPLGSGLILIGLGLGLAFLALRVRRT